MVLHARVWHGQWPEERRSSPEASVRWLEVKGRVLGGRGLQGVRWVGGRALAATSRRTRGESALAAAACRDGGGQDCADRGKQSRELDVAGASDGLAWVGHNGARVTAAVAVRGTDGGQQS